MILILIAICSITLIINIYALLNLFPKNNNKTKSVLLDTSAIMDGRIVEVVKSGFVPEQLIIPRFVIAEMQLLADKGDHIKRERARYGLQVIQDIQNSKLVNVLITSEDIKEESGVDEKLIKLAQKKSALLFTTDFNLLKVAEIEGIRVLNINELAQNLRITHIPGEQTEIKIVGKGQERAQGIGYLEDGTLVVVENGSKYLGKSLVVEFTRHLQTASGRMLFAKTAITPIREEVASKHSKNRREASSKTLTPRRSRPMSAEDKLLDTINNS